MSRREISITLQLEVDGATDGHELASSLFDFLCDDPDNLFPAIHAVTGYDVRDPGSGP